MIAEIIVIWILSIYFSMYFAGQKDMSIKKAFIISLIFSIGAMIYYLMYVPKHYYAKYRIAWGGLGFFIMLVVVAIAIYEIAYFYFTHPTII